MTYYTCGTCTKQYKLRTLLNQHQEKTGHTTTVIETDEISDTHLN